MKDLKCSCWYCNQHDWLFEFPNEDKIYLEIPKNASSIAHSYFGIARCNNNLHLTLDEFKNLKDNKDLSGVIILREPIDRFKSLISHYFFNGGRKDKGKEWLKTHQLPELNYSTAAEVILDNFHRINSISEPHHWFPQSYFIPDEFIQLKKIQVYNLDTFRKEVTQRVVNTSNSQDVEISKKDRNRIEQIYSNDFKLYNTYFD